MALFLHTENQNLLWNIISNMDITKSVFVEGSPQRALWFKNIIEEYYFKNFGRNLSMTELRDLNKEVIAYMVENLKTIQKNTQRQPQVIYQEPQTVYSRNPQSVEPNKQEHYNVQFSNRQKEYETMIKKPLPPEINFSDNIKDEPISNMEELLKQQQQMREYELNQQSSWSITDKSLINIGQRPTKQNEHIKIHKEENITVDVDNELSEFKQKKVSWSDEFDIKGELSAIKSQIMELVKLVQQLQNPKINITRPDAENEAVGLSTKLRKAEDKTAITDVNSL